jgi:hypothetical protein
MGGRGLGDLDLVRVLFLSQPSFNSLLVQDEGDSYNICATPDRDLNSSTSSASITPFTSLAGSSKLKSEIGLKPSSRASTPKSRSLLKRTLQDAFAEGSARDTEVLERLGTQKHERAIGELELKRRKLENKAMEKQHQREREREEHEFRMMQMRIRMAQNQQAAPGIMQPQNQLPLNGFGLMDELNDPSLPS